MKNMKNSKFKILFLVLMFLGFSTYCKDVSAAEAAKPKEEKCSIIDSAQAGVVKVPRIGTNWGLQSLKPQSVTGSAIKIVLEPTEEFQLSVSKKLETNTNLVWSSSNTRVAIVDKNGVVTALTPGNAVITVRDKIGTYEEKINILVVEDASDYRLTVDLKISKTCRLTVDDFTFTRMVTWTTIDPEVATITNRGKVTAVKEGLTLAIATDDKGKEVGRIYIRVRK